eukprot:TRINITY_DN8019_c0_g2_i1.p1 TRINITY_DN8019_c0_g2~~TRINITY_DN8019_c0_g2_i1.p1  ORF type:complete len:283 (-),score=25.48 TRINITY_DN8019_c0_g2_i1:95-943(-)
MEGSPPHAGDKDSDDDVKLVIRNTFYCASPRNRGTAARRSKSCSDSSSSSQQINPNILYGNDSSSLSDSLSDVRPDMTRLTSSSSRESGTMLDTRLQASNQDGAKAGAIANLPSAGASLHESGNCRPCRFLNAIDGCRLGEQCIFCHHPSHSPMATGKSFRRPSKCVRKGLKKRIIEISESDMSEVMKKEAYLRLAGENAYVGSLLKRFQPDFFENASDIKEAAARVSAAPCYPAASSSSSTAPVGPRPRMPGLVRESEQKGTPVAPGMVPAEIEKTTKMSL